MLEAEHEDRAIPRSSGIVPVCHLNQCSRGVVGFVGRGQAEIGSSAGGIRLAAATCRCIWHWHMGFEGDVKQGGYGKAMFMCWLRLRDASEARATRFSRCQHTRTQSWTSS